MRAAAEREEELVHFQDVRAQLKALQRENAELKVKAQVRRAEFTHRLAAAQLEELT